MKTVFIAKIQTIFKTPNLFRSFTNIFRKNRSLISFGNVDGQAELLQNRGRPWPRERGDRKRSAAVG
jgi:hypothetical protein